jgi:YEATS domain-containing protein 4
MTDSSVNSQEIGVRQKGVTIVKPIVYGNVARYFGKKREEDGHTHHWTIYVKPFRNEDMSVYVKKVHFRLHESYNNANRVVMKPPYEVTETGWGEFEIIIKIYFNDPIERPVTIYHLLKLFQTEADIMLGKKNLVSEFYDELVFQDPSVVMQQLLIQQRPVTLGAYKHETEFEEKKEKNILAVMAAKGKIRLDIQQLSEQLKASKDEISKLKHDIAQFEANSVHPVMS